jgi:hypothetical protein
VVPPAAPLIPPTMIYVLVAMGIALLVAAAAAVFLARQNRLMLTQVTEMRKELATTRHILAALPPELVSEWGQKAAAAAAAASGIGGGPSGSDDGGRKPWERKPPPSPKVAPSNVQFGWALLSAPRDMRYATNHLASEASAPTPSRGKWEEGDDDGSVGPGDVHLAPSAPPWRKKS